MDFVKRHRIKLVVLAIFIIAFVVALVVLLKLLYPDSRKDVYGNRLEGIESIKISNQVISEIKDKISLSEFVDNVEYDLRGRLVYFTIEVKADSNKDETKKLVDNITDTFDSDIKAFYDIQVIIIEDKEESENYPIFAYKHKTSNSFVWTNN